VLNKQKAHLSEQEKSVVSGLLKKDKELMCCANCASIDLTFPPTNIDAIVGAGSLPRRYYCRECEYEGLPLIFDKLSSYEKFYSLRREKYTKGEDLLIADRLLSGNFGSEPVKKPYVAALLSLLIPGLGQAYNGEKKKAELLFALFALIVIFGIGLGMLMQNEGVLLFTLYGLMLLFVFAFIDAYIVAKTKK
jgi:hypothetical protein